MTPRGLGPLKRGGTADLKITLRNGGNGPGAVGVVSAFANGDELPLDEFNCTTGRGAGWVSTSEFTAQVAVKAKAKVVIKGLKLPFSPGKHYAVVLLDSTCKNQDIYEAFEAVPSMSVVVVEYRIF
jgi:hypothetical protein